MAARKAPAAKPATNDRNKALEVALSQIDKQFGKGSVMRLGDDNRPPVQVIPTGSLALDVALNKTVVSDASNLKPATRSPTASTPAISARARPPTSRSRKPSPRARPSYPPRRTSAPRATRAACPRNVRELTRPAPSTAPPGRSATSSPASTPRCSSPLSSTRVPTARRSTTRRPS